MLGLPAELLYSVGQGLQFRDLEACLQAGRAGLAFREQALQRAAAHWLGQVKFPWGSAAYVLGLNGSYFSSDTLSRHADIPDGTVELLTGWVRRQVSAPFTSIRVHK